jgi:hypothetical protein
MMTAIAFILGVVPLVVATGAGANSRQSIGTTVIGGMIGSASMDQLVVPVFFVILLTLSTRLGIGGRRPHGSSGATKGDPPSSSETLSGESGPSAPHAAS